MRYIPKILSLIILWGVLVSMVMYLDPEIVKDVLVPGLYLPFFGILSFAIWYTLWIFLGSLFKSLLLATTVILGVVLSAAGLMHPGLAVVLVLTLVIESWYIYHSYEKINSAHERKDRGTGL